MQLPNGQARRRPRRLTVDVNVQSRLQQQEKKKRKTYSTRLAKERGTVRSLLTEHLRTISGDETARMRWNAEDFFAHVAKKYAVSLKGWPAHLLFTNLSGVPGGIRIMRELSSRAESGILAFVALTPAQARALTLETAAPGSFVPRPPRAVRRDYGKQRVLPWLRLSRRPRQMRLGPKSAEYIEDSDGEEEGAGRGVSEASG